MPFGGTIAIRVMKDGESFATPFIGTEAGLQAAIDSLGGGRGEVRIGPGILTIAAPVSIHSGCSLTGSGKGVTIIQRQSGSLHAGDANYSGNMILTTKLGSNGTPNFALADAQSDICISDLTLHGNYSTMGGVNPGNPRHMGIFAVYVNRFTVRNVEVTDFGQSAMQFDACANLLVYGCHMHEVGQYASPSAKNGVSIINNQAATSPYASDCKVTECLFQNIGDTAIDFANVSNCQYTNCIVDNPGGLSVEFENNSALATVMENFLIEGIQVRNLDTYFVSMPAHTGVTIRNVTIANCSASLVDNGVAGGINMSAAESGASIEHVKIIGNRLRWASITNSGVFAVNGVGNMSYIDVKDNTFENVPGAGIQFYSSLTGIVQSDIEIDGNVINGCNNAGIQFFDQGAGPSTHKRIRITRNKIIDACQFTNNFAIGLTQSVNDANQVMQDFYVYDNTIYKITAGSTSYGIRLYQNGAGTLDRIFMANNVVKGFTVSAYRIDNGTPTNCYLVPIPGKGTNITAAATITIPSDGDLFHVTGNTNITNGITVLPWDNGRTVVLVFEGTPTVSDTGTSKLAGNFVAAGTTNDFDTLTLKCDGTNWYELSRSPN